MTALVAVIVGGGLVLPIFVGLAQTFLPAFGILDAVGGERFSLEPWRKLFALPGFGTSLRLSITSGLVATFLSLALAACFFAVFGGRARQGLLRKFMTPLLASPHAAVAIAMAFLIAPSGWIFRLLSPWATGQTYPPNIIIVHDPLGLSLILGLVVKETPFLLFMMAAALKQVRVADHLKMGRSLGYGRASTWFRIIFPQVYPQIRLAVYAVLAFSLSVIDAALILGPNNPPPLAVQTLRWFSDPNSAMILPAAASAVLQLLVILGAIALWWVAERLIVLVGRLRIDGGVRSAWLEPTARLIGRFTVILVGLGIAGLVGLVIWSLTWRWRFPDALPEAWSLKIWGAVAGEWLPALTTTALIGAVSTLLSLCLAIAWLEAEDRANRPRRGLAAFVIYWPLILPQTAFLFSLHIAFLRTGFGGGLVSVIWVHMFFVFPYVMLALADPWRALDRRYARAAASLGHSKGDILLRIKLPLLLGPLMAAAAVGFAVSVAQYLATLTIGEGRIVTLTTEAVARSSGADRRIIAVFASLQALLPMLVYVLALLLPAILYARRRGLLGDQA
nr:ABC transporter permease subunit [Rhizobium sp. L1K21]